MKGNYFRGNCLLFLIGLSLFMSGVLIAKEKEEATSEEEMLQDEVRSIRETQGRVDSIRPEKIVITYEPEGQEGSLVQTHYLRDADTQFIHRDEARIKPGDIVTINYEETRWVDEKGKRRAKRIAKVVSFVCTREVEESRKENEKSLKQKGQKRNVPERVGEEL